MASSPPTPNVEPAAPAAPAGRADVAPTVSADAAPARSAAPRFAPVRGEVGELLALFEISRCLDRTLDTREALSGVLQAMAQHLGMLRGTLALLNRETGEIVVEAAYGLSDAEMQRGVYRVGEGVTGRVVSTGQPAVVPRIAEDPLFLDRTGARARLDKRDIAFICVPLTLGDEVMGALSADRLFSRSVALEEDVRLLTVIATMLAQAVRLRRAVSEERSRLQRENQRLQAELQGRFHPQNLVGNSKASRAVYDQVATVARSDTTVLIRGESGVGKELVAHAIHYSSARASRPFVRVNCAALPASLVESELFGHEKGAFTGAVAQRKGRFELAAGGTLFLDEIGEFAPSTQALLLRVLQEREFERVGGSSTLRADVRVIAATNRELELAIAQGRFREDLYYRLSVFPIVVPPLRERRTDIPLLCDHFVEKYARALGKPVRRVSTAAIDMLMNYHWPGNVRELENCIERACLLTQDEVIHGHHLPPTLQTAEASGTVARGSLDEALARLERDLVTEALKASRGNVAKAARALGLTERVMGLRVGRHGIEPKRFKVPGSGSAARSGSGAGARVGRRGARRNPTKM